MVNISALLSDDLGLKFRHFRKAVLKHFPLYFQARVKMVSVSIVPRVLPFQLIIYEPFCYSKLKAPVLLAYGHILK
jgi:hypothetical protein